MKEQAIKIPDRIARLEKDKRGYPIPWNVLRGVDNQPVFTVNDDRRHYQALKEDRCQICGERMGRWHWWVGGPRNAFHEHGWYLDLFMHHDCAQFALQTCPYLAMPRYLPDRIAVPDPSRLEPNQRILIDQTIDHNRPEMFVAACSDRAELSDNGPVALPYTRPVRPYMDYEFWHHGAQVTAEWAMPILRGLLGAHFELPAKRSDL